MILRADFSEHVHHARLIARWRYVFVGAETTLGVDPNWPPGLAEHPTITRVAKKYINRGDEPPPAIHLWIDTAEGFRAREHWQQSQFYDLDFPPNKRPVVIGGKLLARLESVDLDTRTRAWLQPSYPYRKLIEFLYEKQGLSLLQIAELERDGVIPTAPPRGARRGAAAVRDLDSSLGGELIEQFLAKQNQHGETAALRAFESRVLRILRSADQLPTQNTGRGHASRLSRLRNAVRHAAENVGLDPAPFLSAMRE